MAVQSFDPLLRMDSAGAAAVPKIRDAISAWINAEPFQRLLVAFNWSDRTSLPLAERISLLVAQSVEWDYRSRTSSSESLRTGMSSEQSRWTSRGDLLTKQQRTAAIRTAGDLQLTEATAPRYDSYRSMLVLGGARLSCLLRTRRAAELLRERTHAGELVLLGSARPVSDSERKATDTYAPNAQTEFDLFVSAARACFDTDEAGEEKRQHSADNPYEAWKIHSLARQGQPGITILSAPSTAPLHRRANSADTYRFYLHHYPARPGERFLLVTSQIYVPYQQLEALRVLCVPLGVVVETVGFPPSWGGQLHGLTEPHHYLQEIRSFLQASQRFLIDFPD